MFYETERNDDDGTFIFVFSSHYSKLYRIETNERQKRVKFLCKAEGQGTSNSSSPCDDVQFSMRTSITIAKSHEDQVEEEFLPHHFGGNHFWESNR